jgi:hypothetical protein
MQLGEITQMIGDLQNAVNSDPAAAAQKIADLKSKVASLPPEQQEQVRKAVEELRAKASNLPPELQQQLADIGNTIRGASQGGTTPR